MLLPLGLQASSSPGQEVWAGRVVVGTSWHHDGLFFPDMLDLIISVKYVKYSYQREI